MPRRQALLLLAALGAGGRRAIAQSREATALRLELERTYLSWVQAMRRSDAAALATQTSRYRLMCLRNEVTSLRQPWPSAVFKSVIQAPDVSELTFIDAAAYGDTARAVYFGRVDFSLESAITPENPLIVRFLREGGVWKFDWIQYVNLGKDEELRRDARAGGRRLLDSPEFQLTGRYPELPKPCREPYQIAALSIVARGCQVTVDVNNGSHIETVDNNTGGRVITGGVQKGPNLLTITPVVKAGLKEPPALSVTILTRTENYRPSTKLWSWSPPEPAGQWLPKYEASVFVKSRSMVR